MATEFLFIKIIAIPPIKCIFTAYALLAIFRIIFSIWDMSFIFSVFRPCFI